MALPRLGATVAALAAAAGLFLGSAGMAHATPVMQQTPAPSEVSTPITGTFTDALGGTGAFAGTFTPTQFVNQGGGQLAAIGTLTGTLTDSAGTVVGTVTEQATVPLQVTGTCDILNLNLGALDLDLLGLVVHLDEVVLDVTAEQGPGNLLGNLLCAIAGVLDSNTGGLLNGILTSLLNLVLSLLG